MKRLIEKLFGCKKADRAVEAQAAGDWVAAEMKSQVKHLGGELKVRSKEAVKASRRHQTVSHDLHELLHSVLEKVNDRAPS